MMQPVVFQSRSESDTDQLGRALARVLPPGTTVALHGTLGAGKTRLVRAVAEACGVDATTVVSPTFVLCHEYHGTERPIYHFDVYRIADDDEFLELGPDEYFESNGITFVEWGERVQNCLPRSRWEIEISVDGDQDRTMTIFATDITQSYLLDRLRVELHQ